MDWKHGYFAEGGYTFGYYPETMPSRLRWAALVQGHASPPAGFRYLDAGCGQGLNLLLAAAAHPDSEFVGIDFLPEHIAHARAMASACGVSNVTFIEGDFVELVSEPASLGEFDYAVCHGITTWIAPEVKAALFRLIGKVLRPSGLFYNSYNTFPGWLGSVPFQHLVLLEQRGKTGEKALDAARDNFKVLGECAPGMFNALPALESRMKALESQDPAYLVQEYNNHFWQPVFVSRMIDDMAEAKLSYLGTATLPEAYDNLLPKPVLELLDKQGDPVVREQLRDYSSNQSFRRDLYVKGRYRPWPGEFARLLGECRFLANPFQERPVGDDLYSVRCGTGETKGDRKFYDTILDRVLQEPSGALLSELLGLHKNPREKGGVLQAISMMLYGGWLMAAPSGSSSLHRSEILNRHIAAAVCDGAPYRYVSVPGMGGALPMADTEWMMLNCFFTKLPEDKWLAAINTTLGRLNRGLLKDGQPVLDAAKRDELLRQSMKEFCEKRLPILRATGGASMSGSPERQAE